jgi:hypothetical protein
MSLELDDEIQSISSGLVNSGYNTASSIDSPDFRRQLHDKLHECAQIDKGEPSHWIINSADLDGDFMGELIALQATHEDRLERTTCGAYFDDRGSSTLVDPALSWDEAQDFSQLLRNVRAAVCNDDL